MGKPGAGTPEDCVFCRIVEGSIPALVVERNDWVTAFMDARPVAPGHLLVVPNRHFADMDAIEEPYLSAMIASCRRLGMLVKARLCADGYNVLSANGRAAQQSVFHAHFHVVPRRFRDGIDLWFDRASDAQSPAAIAAVHERLVSR